MTTEKLELKIINWLRFPLIVGVVFLHSTPGYILGPDYKGEMPIPLVTDFETFFLATKILMLELVPKFAVPSFFFISGYLFFLNVEKFDFPTYKYKLKRRVKSLLIPYLLWNVAAISYPLCLYLFRNIPLPDNPIDWLMYFWDADDIYNLPLNYPLWYVRDLMVISVLSPISWILIKHTKWFFMIVLTILYITGMFPHIITGLGKHVLFFFNFGAFVRIHRIDFMQIFDKVKMVNYIISLVLIFVGLFSYERYILVFRYVLALYTISSLISVFNIAAYFVKRLNHMQIKISKFLQQKVFFIYATHTLVFIIIFDILAYNIGNKLSNDLLNYILFWCLPLIKISVCIFIYNVLQKFTPNTLKILTGR